MKEKIVSRLAMVIAITICLLVVLGGQSVAAARTYSVSKSGSNSNPGTDAEPFLTIQKAADIMVAGDIVIVGAGTYVEGTWGLNPANSGTAGNPITYKANGHVVIDGTGANPTVKFDDNNYIVFDGFEVAYGANNIELNNSIGVELKNSTFRDSNESSAVNMRGSVSCHIHHCTVLRAANCGILLEGGAHDNRVEYNTVADSVTNDGLSQGSTNYPAGDNNVWQYNISTGNAEDGIDFYTGNHTIIRGNVLHNNVEKGIYLHGGSNCLVENNKVYDNGGQGLYLGTQFGPGETNTIQNNLFYDNARVVIVAKNNTFINNTFVAKESLNRELVQFYAEEEPEAGSGTVFLNNVFYNRTEKIFNFYLISNINITSDNNLFYTTYSSLASKVGANHANLAAWRSATGLDTHSVSGNPQFRDNQNNDFSLLSGSSAIDVGSNLGAPATDILGNARGVSVDIGAYEYQGPGSSKPVVTFSTPANNVVVSGLVNIGAVASDDLGVTKVEFYIDGELDSTDAAAPYEATWYTTYYTKGNHTITAKAYDASSNIGTATVTVLVNSQVTTLPGNSDVLVKFKTGTSQTAIDAIIQRFGLTTKKILLTGWYGFTVPSGTSVAHMASLLLNQPEVEYAEINSKRDSYGDEEIASILEGEEALTSDDQMLALDLDLAGLSAVIPLAQNNVSVLDGNLTSVAGAQTITNSVVDMRGDKLQSAGIITITTYGLSTVLSLFALACLSLARRVLIA